MVATVLIKLSIGAFLLRIAMERYQIYTIYCVLSIQVTFSIFYFFFILFQCDPISYFWERVVKPGGSCGRSHAIVKVTYAHGAIIALGDWTLGILPMFIVWNMSLKRRTKISVAVLLAFGSM